MEKCGGVLMRWGAMRKCEEESTDVGLCFLYSVPFWGTHVEVSRGAGAGLWARLWGIDRVLCGSVWWVLLTCFYKRNFQDEDDTVLSFGGQRRVLVDFEWVERKDDIERPYRARKRCRGKLCCIFKAVGSYERSMSYGCYGSWCARKSGVIVMNGDTQAE